MRGKKKGGSSKSVSKVSRKKSVTTTNPVKQKRVKENKSKMRDGVSHTGKAKRKIRAKSRVKKKVDNTHNKYKGRKGNKGVSKVKDVGVVRRGDSFRYYNLIVSSVRSNSSLSIREARKLASEIYLDLKTKYGVGTTGFRYALENIDDLVKDYLRGDGEFVILKQTHFIWWATADKIFGLPKDSYLILNSKEIDEGLEEYEGTSYNFSSYYPIFNKSMNYMLQRKNYAWTIQVFIRDEEKQKEMFFFFVVPDESPKLDYSAEEINEFVRTNVDIDFELSKLPIVPKERSAYRDIPYDVEGVKVAKELEEKAKEEAKDKEEWDKYVAEHERREKEKLDKKEEANKLEIIKAEKELIETKINAFEKLQKAGLSVDEIKRYLGI